jgi:hypothetical protein
LNRIVVLFSGPWIGPFFFRLAPGLEKVEAKACDAPIDDAEAKAITGYQMKITGLDEARRRQSPKEPPSPFVARLFYGKYTGFRPVA